MGSSVGLSAQEFRCLEAVALHLGERLGGVWIVESENTLDQQNQNRRSPETILRSDKRTAAVEVKRLPGSPHLLRYSEAMQSLRRHLAPPCGGTYYLRTPHRAHVPFDKRLRRMARREVARVAPTMEMDTWVPLNIPGLPDGPDWGIIKLDQRNPGVVNVIDVLIGDWRGSILQQVCLAVDSAVKKFEERWADIHIIALECSQMAPPDEVVEALSSINPTVFENVDVVVAIDDESVHVGFDRDQEASA